MAEKAEAQQNSSFSRDKRPLDGVLNGGTESFLQRRILFHPARNKTDNGCRPDNFYLEPLNPQPDLSTSAGIGNPGAPKPATHKPQLQRQDEALDSEFMQEPVFRRIGAGLANLGNTCFLNSVLQCLTYTQPLAAYFQSGRHKLTCRVAGFCAMCAIQDHAISALGSSGKILSPSFLVRNLRCISRNFQISRQEDAHEYMMSLMEAMHKCCLPAGVKSESQVSYEKSLVHKIFGGRLISQVKCTQCSYCSNTFDPFLDLSLEIIRADSLLKALSHYTAVEQLDGGQKRYQCERCKVKVKALKQLKIDKAPYILAIHLKRFSTGGSGGKIDKKVDFGCTLDLKPFVSSSQEGNLKYTLYGVLVHVGSSTHSGHYYCFIRTSTGIWHGLDDNRVYQVSEKVVLSQKAYVLFYIQDKKSSIKPACGSESEGNDSKLNKTMPLKTGCPKENQLQDSSASQMTESLFVNSLNAADVSKKDNLENRASARQPSCETEPKVNHNGSLQLASTRNKAILTNDVSSKHALATECKANNSCNSIRQRASKVNGTVDMDNCNEIDVVRRSRNSTMNNENGHWNGGNPGVGSMGNGMSLPDANNSRTYLTSNGCGHFSDKTSRNDSNGTYGAFSHLENGHTASSSMGDGYVFQAGENVTLVCKANKRKGSLLETSQTLNLSEPMKEHKNVSKQKCQENSNASNCLISSHKKLKKNLKRPRFLQTFPFTRHLLLKAVSSLRKKRYYERRKHIKLHSNNADIPFKSKNSGRLTTRKEYAHEKKSVNSIASKIELQQSCGEDLSNRQYYHSNGQHDVMPEMTDVSEYGYSSAKVEQCNGSALALGRRKFSSGNSNGFTKLKKIDDEEGFSKVGCNDSDVEPSSKINKESLILAHPRNAIDTFPVGIGLNEEKNSSVRQSNYSSMNGVESCQQESAFSLENSKTSLEAKLRGATVPCWDGVDDGWVKSNRAWENQSVHLGYVLDEWDEEYDRGKRKKIKHQQLKDGTHDSYETYSNEQKNPFQSLANSKAKIHSHKGNSFTRSNQVKICGDAS